MSLYDELMLGAIDLHCHINVEFSVQTTKRESEFAWLPKAEAMGMQGVVLKSHWWPTAPVIPYIKEVVRTKVEVWSSVTLNPCAGGLDLAAVEACAALGGRMIFLPTWGARNDIERKAMSQHIRRVFRHFSPGEGLTLLQDNGSLIPWAYELIALCKELGLALGTGHISWQESLAMARAAHAAGFTGLIVNHPLSTSVGAPLQAVQEMAELGAFIEVCWTQLAPGRFEPQELVRKVRTVGVDHLVASTDYFRPYAPNPPELLRFFLGMLHEGGLTRDEIRQVVVENPARVLNLA